MSQTLTISDTLYYYSCSYSAGQVCSSFSFQAMPQSPLFCQLRSCVCTVWYGGKCDGNSFHAHPVRR